MLEARFYRKHKDKSVTCELCSHKCKIGPDRVGICRVRKNVAGTLYALNYGKVIAAHIDPIEKKPLRNFHPGSQTFSIACPGCNFRCDNCQNWQISQATPDVIRSFASIPQVEPLEVVQKALESKTRIISYTYTEPTVFGEFALDTMKLAKGHGLMNVWVTNGFFSNSLWCRMAPWLDAANVDLKGFSDTFYRTTCKARFQPVKRNIKAMVEYGVHVEVTTLIIPGKNDDDKSLNGIAAFLSSLKRDVPWHVIGFMPEISYKLRNHPAASCDDIHRACDIGRKAGLKYVYGDE